MALPGNSPLARISPRIALGRHQLAALALAYLILFFGATSSVELIEQRVRQTLDDSLQTLLDGTDRALEIWARDHRLSAQHLAQSPLILNATRQLLASPLEQPALMTSPAQQALRRLFQFYLQSKQYHGFFIIDRDNINLASSRDGNIGQINLLTEQPEVLAKLWAGHSAISRVQRSDVPLGPGGDTRSGPMETMFVGAPIKDDRGQVVALLTLRIDPHSNLFPLLSTERLGNTGDTYAFDRQGLMLSSSRFEDQLRQLGMLSPGEHSALNIHLRDPGVDLSHTDRAAGPQPNIGLTRMAASAVQGRSGIDLDGYRDYRGAQVIGAWRWDDQLGIGLATEQDINEAYALFQLVRSLIYLGGTAVGLILLALALVFSQGRRQVREIERRLRAIVETANDAIIVIDHRGLIETVNPATGKLFGHSPAALIGQNVKVLMPEPYHSEHDQYLQQYQHSGRSKIIGVGREVMAKRADGSVFEIDLSINRLELASGTRYCGIIHDISARKQAERTLQREKETAEATNSILKLTQMALEGTGTAEFWISTADQRVVRANNRACRHLGYSRDELLTLRVPDFDPNFSAERFDQRVASYKQSGWGRFESAHLTRDGRLIPVEVTVMYRPARSSSEAMFIAFVNDITERKQAEAALVQARQQAEAAAEAKAAFLATMSHELRTPMNAVIGMTDIVLETELTPFQRKHLTTVARSSQNLLSILNEILDLSKLENDRMQIERVPLELRESLLETMLTLQHQAETKGLQLSSNVAANVPAHIYGDPLRLRQILINLVGNAIKFTERGSVRVDISRYSDNAEQLHFQVIDSGIGIAPERLEQIFNPFTQADSSTSRKYGGTGLGTTISRQLVEKMGGHIWVDSELGCGSTFHFTLPLQTAQATELNTLSPGRPVQAARARRPLSILLAEDVPENAELVQLRLEQQGHQVCWVDNGRLAVERFRQQPFDLILMDAHMPVLDGFEASRAIRQLEMATASPIPIIAITASALLEERQQCAESGMNGFCEKPVDFSKLQAEMVRLLPDLFDMADHGQPEPPAPPPLNLPDQLIALDKALQLWGDQAAYFRVLRQFPARGRQISDQLHPLLAEQAQAQARLQVHQLKGICGNLGLVALDTVAAQLERALQGSAPVPTELLAALETALTDTIEAIDQLPSRLADSHEPAGSGGPWNPRQAAERLQQLKQMLAQGQMDDQLCQQTLALLHGRGDPATLAALDDQLHQFEFDAAQQLIDQLLRQLGLASHLDETAPLFDD